MAKGTGSQSGGPGGGRPARAKQVAGGGRGSFLDMGDNDYSTDAQMYKAHSIQVIDKHLTTSERESLKAFTGSTYTSINDFLRTGKTSTFHQDSINNYIKGLDSAFSKPAVKLPRNTVLYRKVGAGHPIWKDLQSGNLQIGKVYQDKGYQSTSVRKDVWWGEVTFRIRAKKGAKALHVESLSAHKPEKETLLPRDAKFKVKSFEYKHGLLFVDVDYL